MLTLPAFDVVSPRSIEHALEALDAPGARLLAGGTDLLPNLKHRITTASTLVSLHRLTDLQGIEETTEALRLGAMCTLTQLAEDALIREWAPSLSTAASLVASPQIRNVGTLGGNIHLDTRCRYVNQTPFWRETLGGCLKAETCETSSVCHVVPKGKRCVAAMSSDTVPVLVSLDSTLVLRGRAGEREVAIADYFRPDGTRHLRRKPHELLTHVVIPKPRVPRRTTYLKWRPRKSIDFPLVSIALCFEGAESITAARAVLGVLGASPRVVQLEACVGRRYDDPQLAPEVARAVRARAKPLPNVPYDAAYRARLVEILTRRAVEVWAREAST